MIYGIIHHHHGHRAHFNGSVGSVSSFIIVWFPLILLMIVLQYVPLLARGRREREVDAWASVMARLGGRSFRDAASSIFLI